LKILSGDNPENLKKVVELLRGGNVVALPTETVYGLAADALCPKAVGLIFEIKKRPTNDPLIVHVPSFEEIERVAFVPSLLGKLAEAFWPGPLTVVLRKKACVPDLVTSGLSSIAVRIPAHPLFRQILKSVNRPLAAPSANPFGYLSPTRAEHVVSSFGETCPCVLDGGPTDYGIESTILSLVTPTDPIILRPGPLSAEDLSEILGSPLTLRAMPADLNIPVTPGSFSRHYSPKTPMQLHKDLKSMHREINRKGSLQNTGIVLFKRPSCNKRWPTEAKLLWLSEHGNLSEAASRLYEILRTLDTDPLLEIIHCEASPDTGIGIAINDRLRRATAQS
jgi:L-threonylcarbamoyladenylate synthase